MEIQCRARIVIGRRHYAGYLHNISRGGAKLRTITPIRKIGSVILTLPDLPPLRCQLRWADSYNAGVAFELPLPRHELSRWAKSRTGTMVRSQALEVEIAEALAA
jgi:hypothetical protein